MPQQIQKKSQISSTIQATPVQETRQVQTQKTGQFAGPENATVSASKFDAFQSRMKELMMMENAGNPEIAELYKELYREAKEEHEPLKTDLSMSGIQKVKTEFIRRM